MFFLLPCQGNCFMSRCSTEEEWLDNQILNMSKRNPVRTWGYTLSWVCNWFSLKVCVCAQGRVYYACLCVCVCVCLPTRPPIKGTWLWSLMATLIFNGKRVVSKEQQAGTRGSYKKVPCTRWLSGGVTHRAGWEAFWMRKRSFLIEFDSTELMWWRSL